MKFTALSRLLAATVISLLVSTSAFSADIKAGNIHIKNLWVKTPPKGAKVAGGYVLITNTGKTSDRLIGGTFSSARKVEIHEMSMKNDIMMMSKLEKGLEIKPGQTVELKSGSFHLMIMGLNNTLNKGDSIKGVLQFEKAGKVDVEYMIKDAPATSKSKHTHH